MEKLQFKTGQKVYYLRQSGEIQVSITGCPYCMTKGVYYYSLKGKPLVCELCGDAKQLYTFYCNEYEVKEGEIIQGEIIVTKGYRDNYTEVYIISDGINLHLVWSENIFTNLSSAEHRKDYLQNRQKNFRKKLNEISTRLQDNYIE